MKNKEKKVRLKYGIYCSRDENWVRMVWNKLTADKEKVKKSYNLKTDDCCRTCDG